MGNFYLFLTLFLVPSVEALLGLLVGSKIPKYSLHLRRDVKDKSDLEARAVLVFTVALVCCRPST